jgi:hypothetical protein
MEVFQGMELTFEEANGMFGSNAKDRDVIVELFVFREIS